jgi:ABC-type multidrug transport system ATPase subunit
MMILKSFLNAMQMLRIVAELNGFSGNHAGERIDSALETVGLLNEATKKIAFYSRGMRQRLGIAELLINYSVWFSYPHLLLSEKRVCIK